MSDGYGGRQLDLILSGFGRFVKSWGTDQKAQRRVRRQIVIDLYNAGQLDVLRALMKRPTQGGLTWADVLAAKRAKRLGSDSLAADLALSRPLWAAIDATLPRMGKSANTRGFYGDVFGSLQTRAAALLPSDAQVKSLGDVDWSAIWAAFADTSPAWRNRVRASVSAFLTVYLDDKWHPFRRRVVKRAGTKEREPKIPKSISVEEFWQLMAHVHEALVPAFVTLAATGMRVGEFLACTERDLARFPTIHVPGGKTGEGTVEVDPELEGYIRSAIPCRIASTKKVARPTWDQRYRRLQRAIKAASEATGIPATVHTLRHFYASEGVKAQPQGFVQQALRHTTPAMTQRYSTQRDTAAVARSVGRALRKQA